MKIILSLGLLAAIGYFLKNFHAKKEAAPLPNPTPQPMPNPAPVRMGAKKIADIVEEAKPILSPMEQAITDIKQQEGDDQLQKSGLENLDLPAKLKALVEAIKLKMHFGKKESLYDYENLESADDDSLISNGANDDSNNDNSGNDNGGNFDQYAQPTADTGTDNSDSGNNDGNDDSSFDNGGDTDGGGGGGGGMPFNSPMSPFTPIVPVAAIAPIAPFSFSQPIGPIATTPLPTKPNFSGLFNMPTPSPTPTSTPTPTIHTPAAASRYSRPRSYNYYGGRRIH